MRHSVLEHAILNTVLPVINEEATLVFQLQGNGFTGYLKKIVFVVINKYKC